MPDDAHNGVPRLLMFIDMPSMSLLLVSLQLRYFIPLVLTVGEDDLAGEGLAAGLGFAGVVSVALGEADIEGDGLAAFGELELLAGSQAAANTSQSIVRSRSAVRLMMLVFGVRISFLSSFQEDRKARSSLPGC
jgi:hypothetical protein